MVPLCTFKILDVCIKKRYVLLLLTYLINMQLIVLGPIFICLDLGTFYLSQTPQHFQMLVERRITFSIVHM